MFAMAAQSGGLAKALREEEPLTVFALSNRAFAHLAKEDRETLMKSPRSLNLLLTHYAVRVSIRQEEKEQLASARTLSGARLHIDSRTEGFYVNGAKIRQGDIHCSNGVLHVLDSFDPEFVHEAVSLASRNGRAK